MACSIKEAPLEPARVRGGRPQFPSLPAFILSKADGLPVLAGALLLIGIAATVLSGCKTARRESDLPWNQRQTWEGAPALPAGFGSH